jgi:hypothetical protein
LYNSFRAFRFCFIVKEQFSFVSFNSKTITFVTSLHFVTKRTETGQKSEHSRHERASEKSTWYFLQNLFAVESRCGNDRFHTVQKAAKFTRKDKRERSPESHKKKESYTARRVKGQQSSI